MLIKAKQSGVDEGRANGSASSPQGAACLKKKSSFEVNNLLYVLRPGRVSGDGGGSMYSIYNMDQMVAERRLNDYDGCCLK